MNWLRWVVADVEADTLGEEVAFRLDGLSSVGLWDIRYRGGSKVGRRRVPTNNWPS